MFMLDMWSWKLLLHSACTHMDLTLLFDIVDSMSTLLHWKKLTLIGHDLLVLHFHTSIILDMICQASPPGETFTSTCAFHEQHVASCQTG